MTNVSLPLPNNGYFIARSDTVGSSDDELKNCHVAALPEERQTQIARCAVAACETLKNVEPEGRC